MKFSFKSFVIGFACAALSLGVVTYANAAGNGTLKACANKKTGVMRYISKGSCNKKTETSLSWNQMGPQGLSGAAGTNGASGTTGTKGDAGAAGTNGMNGQNLFVYAANGTSLGQALSATSSAATLLVNGYIWTFDKVSAVPSGFYNVWTYYSDSSCTRPFIRAYSGDKIDLQGVGVLNTETDEGAYIPTGNILTFSGRPVYFIEGGGGTCVAMSSPEKLGLDSEGLGLWQVTKIPLPNYVGPLSYAWASFSPSTSGGVTTTTITSQPPSISSTSTTSTTVS